MAATSVRPLLPSLAVLALATVTALVVAGCTSEAKAPPPVKPAIVAQPRPAGNGALETYSGEVTARYQSALGFRIGGKVEQRLVDVGSRVKRGQPLARLEPQDARLAVSSARAAVASAEADVALAQAELERHASMLAKKFISQALYDARDNQLKAAKARLEQARAQLALAGNQAEYTTLTADADGVITAVAAEVGQVVAAGQPVVTLAHEGELEVLINVPEGRIERFRAGEPVAIAIWAQGDGRLEGKIREIAPAADPRTRTYDVRAALEPGDVPVQLGMTARVYLTDAAAEAAQMVPLAALHERDGAPALWVVDAQTRQVRLTPVEVARYDETGVAVTGGLAPDAWIVTAGVHKLVEGQTILPIGADNRPIPF